MNNPNIDLETLLRHARDCLEDAYNILKSKEADAEDLADIQQALRIVVVQQIYHG